ncbi:hypothetical protein NQ315_015907 [Exocentrus adspersus]|uniref:Uncharacterized protein n=1 Tax=Exocentrus adspersus TaxID=1586481 RepID=A0AAV8W3Q4_9CUCU|nr:hypothetical protein NQ315_015907 [Exocentrus adspersus]
MGQLVPVLVAYLLLCFGIQYFREPREVGNGPLVSSYIFMFAAFLLLWDIRLYPKSLRRLGIISQAIVEFLIASFLFENIMVDFWFPLEVVVLASPAKLADGLEEMLQTGDWSCDGVCEFLRDETTSFAVSYILSIFFVLAVLHSTRAIDLRLLESRLAHKLLDVSILKVRKQPNLRLCNSKCFNTTTNNKRIPLDVVLALSILTWLGFTKEDEEKESELIMTLKRAVLCTQREQYDKAEQMLHLALRLAQQQQNEQGVLYCYDLMANLAFDQYQLDKAEKLFVSVMQILFSKGFAEDDLKVIHISLKLARICQLKANLENAELGYQWCLEKIDKHKNANEDAQILYGVINDWYAQFLLDKGDVSNSFRYLQEAYNVCEKTKGKESEKSVLLLNDLGITSFRAEDMERAEKYLKEAVSVGNKMEDKSHLGVIHANLGLILLEKGVVGEAQKFCKEAWRLGEKYENNESKEQANYCLDQIKLNLGK